MKIGPNKSSHPIAVDNVMLLLYMYMYMRLLRGSCYYTEGDVYNSHICIRP